MKLTQLKDAFRNIRKQKVSFISIILIAALGITTFLGIDYTAFSMHKNGSALYNRFHFRDIEVVSSMLFSAADLEEIKRVEGVADAEPVLYLETKAASETEQLNVGVISITERINRIQLLEGRLPEKRDECALESQTAQRLNLKAGDTVEIGVSDGLDAQYLICRRFTVTGVANHPDHINNFVPVTPYVFVSRDAFDAEALDGAFMKAEVVIDKAENIDRFSASYDQAVAEVSGKIELLAETAAPRRDQEVRARVNAELENGRQKLDEGLRELTSARSELDEKTEEWNEGFSKLEDAQKQLEEAKPLLDAGRDELLAARAKLLSAKSILDSERGKLNDGKAELDEAKAQLDEGKAQLQSGYAELENAKAMLRNALKDAYEKVFPDSTLIRWAGISVPDVEDAAVTASYLWITEDLRIDLSRRPIEELFSAILDSVEFPDRLLVALYTVVTGSDAPETGDGGYDLAAIRRTILASISEPAGDFMRLSDGCIAWNEGHLEYLDSLKQYEDGLRQYNEGFKVFTDAENRYLDGWREYENGLAAYEEKKDQYDKGVSETEAGRRELEEGKALLADGEAQYASGLEEYEDGKAKLDKAQKEYDSQDACRWLIFDAKGNTSFVQLLLSSENFSKMKMTFSMMFVLVGALVIFATVGKMVDEQRSLVGVTKALGFFTREIFAKYLIFGVSATAIGIVLGILAARFGIAPFLLGGLSQYYLYDISEPAILVSSTFVAILAGVLLAVAAIWFACSKLLRESAIRLMQPKAPGTKKTYGARKRGLSLYSRLILLNMRTDLKRVLVTIVSVAGCCALIVIGLSLKASMQSCVERQFADVTAYDLRVSFDPAKEGAKERVKQVLDERGTQQVALYNASATFRLGEIEVAELYCADVSELAEFYRLRDWKTGKPVFPTNEGVLLQRRTAEMHGLDADDRFELALNGVKPATVRVAGVFENYLGRTIVINRGYYEQLFGEPYKENMFFVRLNGADEQKLEAALKDVDGFESTALADSDRTIIESSTSSIDAIVIIFIFIAGVMAGIVLMNLTNLYILQKKRELVIMRINGFTTREVIFYILREAFVTTALGILSGFAIGSGVAYSIIRTVEPVFMHFSRGICYPAWAIGAVITVLFTAIVNFIALRKVKDLKLTDLS